MSTTAGPLHASRPVDITDWLLAHGGLSVLVPTEPTGDWATLALDGLRTVRFHYLRAHTHRARGFDFATSEQLRDAWTDVQRPPAVRRPAKPTPPREPTQKPPTATQPVARQAAAHRPPTAARWRRQHRIATTHRLLRRAGARINP